MEFIMEGCFIGVEVEGPFKGTPTLFIADKDVSPRRIMEFLVMNPSIRHLYFGAGKTYGISEACSEKLYLFRDLIDRIFIEVINEKQIPNKKGVLKDEKVYLIFTLDRDHLPKVPNLLIKTESKTSVVIYSVAKTDQSDLNDILYSLDKKVVL